MAVLILTNTYDPTADDVIRRLHDRDVPVFRVDPADFPQRLKLHAELDAGHWSGVVETEKRSLDLSTVVGVWYRRPRRFEFPDGMNASEVEFAQDEARRGFGGVLNTLPGWLNHPAAIGRAEYKPHQLAEATSAGLNVPRTLVTNDPARAEQWCSDVGRVVYKPLGAATFSEDNTHFSIYTTPMPPTGWGDPALRHTAHLFQKQIDKDYEVRVTVVDEHVFPAGIHTRSDAAQVDWRTDYQALTYSTPPLPRRVLAGVRELTRRLHLRYAAMDFAVDRSGRWWFLEANPNGQYGWIQHATTHEIGEAIADALTKKETR
ncbi:ATP-grasp ribosomal peptide maturase [Salinactinospora qingdaonensis]|uniref:ATP-grasp ribosomal peptide maturase n=1 Tax=Salinactinospora qingdaonensis TaxID=702744 RepID=A0ABP7FHT0_9ACTN